MLKQSVFITLMFQFCLILSFVGHKHCYGSLCILVIFSFPTMDVSVLVKIIYFYFQTFYILSVVEANLHAFE